MRNRNSTDDGMFMLGSGVSTRRPFLLIVLLFFFMGVAVGMTGALPALFGRVVKLSDTPASLVRTLFYGSCLFFALPAALFNRRFCYRRGLALGLAVCAAGCLLFYPALRTAGSALSLTAVCLLAVGYSVLETSANPYLLSLGSRRTALRRLNLAQAFGSAGAAAGLLLGRSFTPESLHAAGASAGTVVESGVAASVQAAGVPAAAMTYVGTGAVLALLFAVLRRARMPRIEENAHPGQTPSAGDSLRRLIDDRRYMSGVAAQFLCVGAQTGVWSYAARVAMEQTGRDEAGGAFVSLVSVLVFVAARFCFAALMRYVRPGVLLVYASIAAVCLTGLVMFSGGMIAVTALIAVSACMSPMVPTLFGLTCEGLSAEDAKIGGAGLVMAVLGGAVMTALQGVIADQTDSIGYSFVIPAFCFVFVGCYGWYAARLPEGERR